LGGSRRGGGGELLRLLLRLLLLLLLLLWWLALGQVGVRGHDIVVLFFLRCRYLTKQLLGLIGAFVGLSEKGLLLI
jgi:hypothetical protein